MTQRLAHRETQQEPGVAAAREAGLRYVSDQQSGIHRQRNGDDWRYFNDAGKQITEAKVIDRINKLAIPPAWTDVWICSSPNGHLQATGRDAKGRKQYRYHPKWRTFRDETKYARMLAFGAALPQIRERTKHDLKERNLTRTKVLATVVRLLETTLIRVGNEEYARDNKSYGLTTMRDKHVEISGETVRFHFVGKSGVEHAIDLRDRRLAHIVQRCKELPGYQLFQYIDEQGNRQTLDSGDVNEYLREITGQDFTAKDFRTWAGTLLASLALQTFEAFDSETQAKKNVLRAIEDVAERLGNTPAICRRCYVHPAVIDSYLEGTLLDTLQQRTQQVLTSELERLKPEEAAILGLLQQRLLHESEQDRAREASHKQRD